jgi:hypothetical protein
MRCRGAAAHRTKKLLIAPLFLALAGIVVSLAFADLVGHVYYRAKHGLFLWRDRRADRVFHVSPYVDLVDDARVVAPKKNFRRDEIEFDANGFRAGPSSYEGRITYSRRIPTAEFPTLATR